MTDSRYFISIIVYWCAFTLYISVIPAVIVSISAGVTKLEGYGNSQLYVHTYFTIILFLVISWGHCILIIKRGLNRFLFLNLFVLTKTEENIIIISFTFESLTKRQIKKKEYVLYTSIAQFTMNIIVNENSSFYHNFPKNLLLIVVFPNTH